jgi:hypothetical protein
MLNESMDNWQRRLCPVEDRWERMKHLRAAVIRREIANEIPLYLAPVIAAYLANEQEITQTSLGAVTAPIVTKHEKTIIQPMKED